MGETNKFEKCIAAAVRKYLSETEHRPNGGSWDKPNLVRDTSAEIDDSILPDWPISQKEILEELGKIVEDHEGCLLSLIESLKNLREKIECTLWSDDSPQ